MLCPVRPMIHSSSSVLRNGIISLMMTYSKKLAQTSRRAPSRSYNRRRNGHTSRYGICRVLEGLLQRGSDVDIDHCHVIDHHVDPRKALRHVGHLPDLMRRQEDLEDASESFRR